MFSQTNLRYRGSNQQIKEQFSKREAKEDEVNLPTNVSSYQSQAFLSEDRFNVPPKAAKVFHAYPVRTATSSPLSFFNGYPTNGTDLCANSQANLCNSFYATQNNSLAFQGFSSFISTVVSVSEADSVAGPCGDVDVLEAFAANWLQNSNETITGNSTYMAAACSYGGTICLDNTFTNVSPAFGNAFIANSNSVITPCVQQNVFDAFDENTNPVIPTSQSSDISYFSYLPIFIMLPIITMILTIATRRRAAEQERRRVQAHPHISAIPATESLELTNITVQTNSTEENIVTPRFHPSP